MKNIAVIFAATILPIFLHAQEPSTTKAPQDVEKVKTTDIGGVYYNPIGDEAQIKEIEQKSKNSLFYMLRYNPNDSSHISFAKTFEDTFRKYYDGKPVFLIISNDQSKDPSLAALRGPETKAFTNNKDIQRPPCQHKEDQKPSLEEHLIHYFKDIGSSYNQLNFIKEKTWQYENKI